MQFKKNIFVVPIFLLLALLSCSQEDKLRLTFLETYCQKIDDINLNAKYIKTFNIIKYQDNPVAFYFNNLDSSINFFEINDIQETNSHKKYYLNNVLKKSILETYSEWLVVNYDTIFAISSRPNSKVYMFNVYDQIIDSFPLHTSKIHNYTCVSSKLSVMKYQNNKLIIPVNSSVIFDTIKEEFYEMQGIAIDIKTKLIDQFGRFSKEEILNFTRYSSPYDYFDIYNNKVIFSSEEDPYIYEYNLLTKVYKRYLAKSKYVSAIYPIADSLIYNRLAMKKYAVESPRYEKIKYCSHNNYFYRIVKHENKIIQNKDFYKKEMPKSKYSMIIMDMDFTIIDEIILEERNDYSIILSTSKGIFFPNMELSSLTKTGVLCLDLFKIE